MPSGQRKKQHVPSVGLINMGWTPQTAIRVIAANIQAMLEVPVEMLAAIVIPEEAFQPHRCQYDAGLVLKYIAEFSFPHHSRILAITDVDLCNPIVTYVFGEAELGLRPAIVSGFRLKSGEDENRSQKASIMNAWPRSPCTSLPTRFPFTIARPPSASCT